MQKKHTAENKSAEYLLGIDAGGTFTDFILLQTQAPYEIRVHKVLSTPDSPDRAIMQGINELGLADYIEAKPQGQQQGGGLHIIHGSTVATNAALQGRFARTAYITNRGFADVLTLARQTRPSLYQLRVPPLPPPVPPELCLELDCRLDASGQILKALEESDVEAMLTELRRLEPEAVAINLLFSFLNPESEQRLVQAIKQELPDLPVSYSASVLPVYKEYERGMATWLNAALTPIVRQYLDRLAEQLEGVSLQIMQSSGDTVTLAEAASNPVRMLLSGPAGGLTALRFLGHTIGQGQLLSFDMGGTSTDVSLLEGEIQTTNEGQIGSYPVSVPMVDIHTIGAGGGSIAFVDAGGMLRVGPRSAGAMPGPACYGLGGTEPTVTDANLILGRLRPDSKLAGKLSLRGDLARDAMAVLAEQLGMSVEQTAAGILQLANEHMAAALRQISVQRGYDVGKFRLTCFGGAGGLHVCELAEAMGMTRALVPVHGGVLSALGMAVAEQGRRQIQTVVGLDLDEGDAQSQISALFNEMEQALRGKFPSAQQSQLRCRRQLDMRYRGQSFTITVDWRGQSPLSAAKLAFQELHRSRYGYGLDAPLELVNLQTQLLLSREQPSLRRLDDPAGDASDAQRVAVVGLGEDVLCLERGQLAANQLLRGPAIVREAVATTFIAPGWTAEVDSFGNLLLSKH
jgi:N-methylhydantoinase A